MVAPGFRQTRNGAARTGYSGFKAFAQRVFCRFFKPDAAHGFDPPDGTVLDVGDAIERISGLFLRQDRFGIGQGGAHAPDTLRGPPLECRSFGTGARMKVAGRRTGRANPPPLVAAPVRFRLRPGFAWL
ncbi:hypothetical protein GCM10008942_26130 [Rhizomicrobium electricum]|uniref:Uncharacterized protein n=1 Tax=Rhizomicrobium electricum TaxID=480070 RepID=A0ABP3PZ06_9PROT